MTSSPQSGVRDASPVLRVLIVDDDFDSAEVLSFVLSAAGCDVRVALDAAAALAIMEEFDAEAAIIDIGLPQITGLELVAQLRATAELHRCRFIAVTGYVAADLPERIASVGFEAYFTKPFSPQALLAALGVSETRANEMSS